MFTVGYADHAVGDTFARGREMNHWTLEYFSAGGVVVRTPHGVQIYKAPSVMLIPPHTPYTERTGDSGFWKERYTIFDPLAHWHMLLSWPHSDCGLGVLNLSNSTIAQEVDETLNEALQLQRSARANRELLIANALEKVLLTLDEINPARGHAQRDARIEQVLEYIAAQYFRTLDLETLAREVYLSPSRFAHLFKTQMKQAPMQYVERYRLERAAEKLLAGGDSIEQIAAAVGFSNAFHFSTRFRRHFGQSPSRYRLNPTLALSSL